jgi:O-antigen/teichoic acid export membrane protein
VATPAFATFQDRIDLIRKRYLFLLKGILCINFPIFILIILFPAPISNIVLGHNLIDAAPFLRLFAIIGLLSSTNLPAGILFISLGRTDLSFKWTIIRIILTVIAMFIAANISIIAVVWAQIIIAFVTVFLYWRVMIYPMAKIELKRYLQTIGRPLLYVILAAIPCLYFAFIPLSIPVSVAFIFAYLIFYLLIIWLLDKQYITNLCQMVFPKLFKRKN